jgi:hypothetical protein
MRAYDTQLKRERHESCRYLVPMNFSLQVSEGLCTAFPGLVTFLNHAVAQIVAVLASKVGSRVALGQRGIVVGHSDEGESKSDKRLGHELHLGVFCLAI